MSDLIEVLLAVFLVSSGSIIGSLIRFKITTQLKEFHVPRFIPIFFVNCLASFFLGLIISFEKNSSTNFLNEKFLLFIIVGLLGSLSTFSSFIWEIFFNIRKKYWFKTFFITAVSIFGGLLFAFAGYKLGNA
ncbi:MULTISPECIES: fluoride efflux transporter FluC [Prochlorococcus]|uniref:fluoride efflux transporter FluC n=1 Tax=Prochlorococcus TaxID=1218 RepID=UPI000569FC3E|nr:MULTISPECIES: CrcB family protein [Prochlorococcus]